MIFGYLSCANFLDRSTIPLNSKLGLTSINGAWNTLPDIPYDNIPVTILFSVIYLCLVMRMGIFFTTYGSKQLSNSFCLRLRKISQVFIGITRKSSELFFNQSNLVLDMG